MRIIKLTGEARANLLSDLIKRSPDDYGPYEATVKEIVADVHKRGDEAVLEYTAKFDKADLTPETMRVTEAEIEEAYAAVDPKLLDVIRKAIKNIEEYNDK